METERRALTDTEIEHLPLPEKPQKDWGELMLIGCNAGVWLALIGVLLNYAFAKFAGLDVVKAAGLGSWSFAGALFAAGAGCAVVLYAKVLVQDYREAVARRASYIDRRDLLVEWHRLVECKLVRDPEHGQPMFFLRSGDDKTIFVLEGKNQLVENWTSAPNDLDLNERPRSVLKLVRWPENGECILFEFDGPVLEFSDCMTIALRPEQWPESGSILSAPWGEIDRRYRLNNLAAA